MKKLEYIIPGVAILVITLAIVGFMAMKDMGTDNMSGNASSTATGQGDKMADEKSDQGGAMAAGDKTASSSADSMSGAKLAGSRISLQNINKLQPGKVTLAFKLYGMDTKELMAKDLKMENDKVMHLLLVRNDLTVFQRLYPEYINDRWTVDTQIAEAGNYDLYVDIAPVAEEPVVLRLPVVIGEPTQKKNFPKSSPNFSEMSGEITAKLDLASPIKAGENIKFNVQLTQNNNPVTLSPSLGSLGQAIVLMHTEPEHYEYVNTLTKENPADGKLQFEVKFPVNGMYTFFTQFNINGQVKTFPITVEVGEGKEGSAESMM